MALGLDDQLAAIKTVVDAIKAKTDRLGTGTVTVQSKVTVGGAITLHAGEAFAEVITRENWGGDNLNGQTGKFRAIHIDKWLDDDVTADIEADVTISQTGTTLSMLVSLSSEATAALMTAPPDDARNYRWQVICGTEVVAGAATDRLTGVMTVVKRIGASA